MAKERNEEPKNNKKDAIKNIDNFKKITENWKLWLDHNPSINIL